MFLLNKNQKQKNKQNKKSMQHFVKQFCREIKIYSHATICILQRKKISSSEAFILLAYFSQSDQQLGMLKFIAMLVCLPLTIIYSSDHRWTIRGWKMYHQFIKNKDESWNLENMGHLLKI